MLEQHDAVDLLRNDLITIATQEIYSEGRTRREIQKDIKAKERAIEALSSGYAKNGLSQEQIRQCLYSIGDNHAFLRVNRDPCDQMIAHLKQYFHPTQAKDQKSSLAIRSGKGGARLSHDHSKQYAYVLQSLTLWREILHGACLFASEQVLSLMTNPSYRYVPLLVSRRTRSAFRKCTLPPPGYRSRSQSSPSSTENVSDDADHPP